MHPRGPALVASAAAVAFVLSLVTISGAVAQVPPLPDLVPGPGESSPTGSPSPSPSPSSSDASGSESLQDEPQPNHPVSANRISDHPDISGDGTQVTFDSHFHEFVSGDSNGDSDVFVRNRSTKTTTIASRTSSAAQGPDGSYDPSISGDGRFVAWATRSSLVPADTNGVVDVYVRDQQLGSTVIASVSSSGVGGNADSGTPTMSADGRFVVFDSVATNLVSGDSNNASDVFLRDLVNNLTTRVSVKGSNNQVNGPSQRPAISADGTYVAFSSDADNVVSGDNNSSKDVFVRDRATNTTTRVSVGVTGNEGNFASDAPSISDNGRYVSFHSRASNLVTGDVNDDEDVFRRDRVANTTVHVSVHDDDVGRGLGSYENSISGDGTKVAFVTFARLVEGDPDYSPDIYVRDLTNNSTIKVSVSSNGEHGNAWSDHPVISGDGNHVGFSSGANNLVAGDDNEEWDIFVHDLETAETLRVSLADGNTPPAVEMEVRPGQGDTATVFGADLSSSQDPDGDKLSYSIDWGDGVVTTYPGATSHRYSSPGEYSVSGTVTDDAGLSSSAESLVRVCEAFINGTCVTSSPAEPDPFVCEDPVCQATDAAEGAWNVGGEVAASACETGEAVCGAAADTVGAARGIAPDVPSDPSRGLTVLSANVMQAFADGENENCPSIGPDHDNYKNRKACAPIAREQRFARRVKTLATKTSGTDGLRGNFPEILLLQEVRRVDLAGPGHIVRYLNNQFPTMNYKIANALSDSDASQDEGNYVTQSETAIIYADGVLDQRVEDSNSPRFIETSYSYEDKCNRSGSLNLDIDLDLIADCSQAIRKRHAIASFRFDGTNRTVAVASVHLITPSHLRDDSSYRRTKFESWANQISSDLQGIFDVDDYVLGGDWNAQRCKSSTETIECDHQEWWRALRFSNNFIDAVHRAHGNSTKEELERQYDDGNKEREKRIDIIWGKGFSGVSRASHDLTCGMGVDGPDNCDRLSNSQRYADHRLLWAIFKLV